MGSTATADQPSDGLDTGPSSPTTGYAERYEEEDEVGFGEGDAAPTATRARRSPLAPPREPLTRQGNESAEFFAAMVEFRDRWDAGEDPLEAAWAVVRKYDYGMRRYRRNGGRPPRKKIARIAGQMLRRVAPEYLAEAREALRLRLLPVMEEAEDTLSEAMRGEFAQTRDGAAAMKVRLQALELAATLTGLKLPPKFVVDNRKQTVNVTSHQDAQREAERILEAEPERAPASD